jgi:cytochrome b involved in lipid metabolism
MTLKEFEDRIEGGEELVIIDDLVLNVGKFKSEHPGGKFLLEHNVGRDISKYFYGGYVLENTTGLKPVRHSNLAVKIVN